MRIPYCRNREVRRGGLVLLALTFFLATSCAPSGAGLTLAGSTSVQPFAELLAEEYMHLHPEVKINVQGGGSSAGLQAALAGAAAIAMSSRKLKGEETQLTAIPIAIDAIAVIVHPENPVSDLSLGQVRRIFAGGIKDWAEVGQYRGAIHIVTREEGSGTRGAFEEMVMMGDDISPRALVQDSSGAVRQLVADDPRSIGYISLGLVDKTVKAIALDGVVANGESIAAGRYALLRPFLFATRGQPEGQAKDFIDFVLGAQGQALLLSEGVLPYKPEAQRG